MSRSAASDFRIWAGTVLAYRALMALEPAAEARVAKRNVVEAIRISATKLGNTEAVARNSYVHPGVLEAIWTDRPTPGAAPRPFRERRPPRSPTEPRNRPC